MSTSCNREQHLQLVGSVAKRLSFKDRGRPEALELSDTRIGDPILPDWIEFDAYFKRAGFSIRSPGHCKRHRESGSRRAPRARAVVRHTP
jgi:hypothetical protein